MEILDYDGQEWMRGHGFPGWVNARWSILLTVIAGTPAMVGCWDLAHHQRDWSHADAFIGTLIDCVGLVLLGLAATVVTLFAIAGLRTWSTIYLIRADAGAIIVEFQRYWGLARNRRELATAAVDAVTTRMVSASGDNIVTDISLSLDKQGSLQVFRSASPAEVEMMVIYLNAACGRHAGAGTAAQIGEQWTAMKATIEARRRTGAAALPPPAGPPPGS